MVRLFFFLFFFFKKELPLKGVLYLDEKGTNLHFANYVKRYTQRF